MSSTKNCHLLQCESGPEIIGSVAARPVFYPDLGAEIASWREARGWSQRQAALIARNRKLKTLSIQALRLLEEGRTKSPDAELLRDLAALYERPYEYVAGRFILARYDVVVDGSDLLRHSGDQQSDPGGSDVPASARRIAELESKIRDYESQFGQMQNAIGDLAVIADRLLKIQTGAARVRRNGRARKSG